MRLATILLFCLPIVAPKAIPMPNSEALQDSALSLQQANVNFKELDARNGWMPSASCAACTASCLTQYGVNNFQFKITKLHFLAAAKFTLCGSSCVLSSQCSGKREENGVQYPQEPGAMWSYMKANGYVEGMGSSSPEGSAKWVPGAAGYPGGA